MTYEEKTLTALRKRFAIELMDQSPEPIKQTPINLGDLQILLLNYVYNHPSTIYKLRDWLIRNDYIVINRKNHIAIVNLDKLRETKNENQGGF